MAATRKITLSIWLLLCQLFGLVVSMSNAQLEALRIENDQLFYHGFESYLKHAFPEDELRPLNCSPLTRDRSNPSRFELNDPLGNYSLTLVDTLSTLAVLASSGSEQERNRALTHFQDGVEALVGLYGDGSRGPNGYGTKSRGFDLDSKVSLFETTIRGVGGLLSAHLFAIGELPIKGYAPLDHLVELPSGGQGTRWPSGFIYDGSLLDLALDLGQRLLPAFSTSTGIPYPRVNLRHGIPFYTNSCGIDTELCNVDEEKWCSAQPEKTAETTSTCTAGAGTLMVEFIVLSRLTGDMRFEMAAKRAFWAIWERKTKLDLVGSDIDAETGDWLTSQTGLGAGVDSFYEYAFKTYILLSGSEEPLLEPWNKDPALTQFYPPPLSERQHQPESFLRVWQKAHKAINRHLHRGKSYGYPHFVQGDTYSGATRAIWMDALSAFYPGLLTLAGHVEEAAENHVLFTALWARYSALPERWSPATGDVEHGLGWWLGRPEFIESNYYLYRATKDPWYLHVGETVLRDVTRLCWVPCGLSGIQDVRTLERNNRMESFFLGETAKYLHLLFSADHPLNNLDEPFVFSTEGHPLKIPKVYRNFTGFGIADRRRKVKTEQCEVPKQSQGLLASNVAARTDLFHAAALVRLPLEPKVLHGPLTPKSAINYPLEESPTNYTFYPRTLPKHLIPWNGTSSLQSLRPTFDITFPSTSNQNLINSLMNRVAHGILVGSLSGLRIGMIQDISSTDAKGETRDLYRIHSINHMPLGRDEKVLIGRDAIASVVKSSDPLFSRIEDSVLFDLVVDVAPAIESDAETRLQTSSVPEQIANPLSDMSSVLSNLGIAPRGIAMSDLLNDLLQKYSHGSGENPVLNNIERYLSTMDPSMNLEGLLKQNLPLVAHQTQPLRHFMPGITAQGAGSAPLPAVKDIKATDSDIANSPSLPWTTIYIGGDGCSPFQASMPRTHQVLVLRRGGCSFTEKLANIPPFPPSSSSLQLVIIVSFSAQDSKTEQELQHLNGRNLIRPLLSDIQITKSGIPRRKQIPLVMIGGGQRVWQELIEGRWTSIGIRRRITVETQGTRIGNLVVL